MTEYESFKKNWLEYGYKFLFTFFKIYKNGYLAEEEYANYKRTVFKNELWKAEFKNLSNNILKIYNLDALRALNKLFFAGGLTKEEYDMEREKIKI